LGSEYLYFPIKLGSTALSLSCPKEIMKGSHNRSCFASMRDGKKTKVMMCIGSCMWTGYLWRSTTSSQAHLASVVSMLSGSYPCAMLPGPAKGYATGTDSVWSKDERIQG
ncbi:hypothetical protein PAXRUDRAFT_144011, partial [Paxillus rubicundulus Ve08.2h10]